MSEQCHKDAAKRSTPANHLSAEERRRLRIIARIKKMSKGDAHRTFTYLDEILSP